MMKDKRTVTTIMVLALALMVPGKAMKKKKRTKVKKGKKQRRGNFDIGLLNMLPGNANNNVTALYDMAFQEAKERWEEVIIGDVLDYSSNELPEDIFNGQGRFPVSMDVDDVVIGYAISDIDGPGNILGQAGPILFRDELDFDENRDVQLKFSTASALMFFDKVDFDNILLRNGVEKGYEQVKSIKLHEMGHALGLGIMTKFKCGNLCHQGLIHIYECGKANTEYYNIFGDTNVLRLSSATGSCDHWTENSFQSNYQSELMTPFFDADKRNPLTAVSVASLADIRYEVNIDAADLWYPDEFFEKNEFGQLGRGGKRTSSKGTVIELNEQNMMRFKPTLLTKL